MAKTVSPGVDVNKVLAALGYKPEETVGLNYEPWHPEDDASKHPVAFDGTYDGYVRAKGSLPGTDNTHKQYEVYKFQIHMAYYADGKVVDEGGQKGYTVTGATLSDLTRLPPGSRVQMIFTGHFNAVKGRAPMRKIEVRMSPQVRSSMSANARPPMTNVVVEGTEDVPF